MLAALCAIVLAVAGCPAASAPPSEPGPPANAAAEPTKEAAVNAADDDRPIGAAEMLEDGTIVMTLRAEGPGGIVGDAQFTYPKGHEKYAKILDHLGGLEPGQSKLVPPWPEEQR